MIVAGALEGHRIVELAGVGPAPFAAMMLADHGAEVIRIDRPGGVDAGIRGDPSRDVLTRSRKSIVLDLARPEAVDIVRALSKSAAGVIEGFRPGVMERLGLGPAVLLADNPRLVYGRVTGWGQTGPLAHAAGHDINYIALAGNLHTYGRAGDKPTPPANAVGDFGGGGMLLAFGMVSALLHAARTGKGQVIDCAMVDGAALIASMLWSLRAMGLWRDERGVNLLDSGAEFYDTYETADDKHVAIGALEERFRTELYERCGYDAGTEDSSVLAALFRTRTRDQWCELLEGTDACFAPVLSMEEAPRHPHNRARGTFVEVDGLVQPAPAPRFSLTPARAPTPPTSPGRDAEAVLATLGYDAARVAALRERGILG